VEPHSSASSLTTFEQLLALPYGSTWPVEFCTPVPINFDALRVVDVLREAQVLDIRCECIRMTVGLLLEMRTAISLVGYDAALIVARGVRLCSWEIGDREGDHGPLEAIHGATWWIGGSELVPLNTSLSKFEFTLACSTSAWLRIRADRFDFFLAKVPNLPEIPDYGAGPSSLVRASIPDWNKPCIPLVYSRLCPVTQHQKTTTQSE